MAEQSSDWGMELGVLIRRFWHAALGISLATGFATAAMAGQPKPSNGSWRIVPLDLVEPLKVSIGKDMVPLVEQRLIPEAAVVIEAATQFGSFSLDAGAALIKVTIKQETVWCAIDPLRTHPGNPKSSFAESLLIGRKVLQRRTTACFADTDADGQMDTAVVGEDRGYLVPTIDKLGKPSPVAPFSVRETDPANLISFPLRLTAGLMSPKKEAPYPIFTLSVSLGDHASDLVGFGLVGGPEDRTSFAMYSGLASIETVFEDAKPLLYQLSPIDADGRAIVTITQAMSARRFKLGNISRF